jgi:D-alanyl-D-alanine carboxypeptidase
VKVLGALAFSAVAFFGTAAASPAPQATATATPDPTILARARAMFAALQAGKIDRSQLNAQANATIDDATIKRAHDVVAPLGTPVTFEPESPITRDGVTLYIYLVTFGGGQSLSFGYALDSAGKVAGMQILPPDK